MMVTASEANPGVVHRDVGEPREGDDKSQHARHQQSIGNFHGKTMGKPFFFICKNKVVSDNLIYFMYSFFSCFIFVSHIPIVFGD